MWKAGYWWSLKNMSAPPTPFRPTPREQGLGETMRNLWGSFARTGDPADAGHGWGPYDSGGNKSGLLFSTGVAPAAATADAGGFARVSHDYRGGMCAAHRAA